MFGKENISKLEEKIEVLQKQLNQVENSVEKRLIEFSKEITDKYFETLEKILRVHTESSLITALAHQVGQKDLDKLKSSLMQPFLEARWKNAREEKGQKIVNNSEQIILERDRLHDEFLTLEKQGKNPSIIKAKLDAYNEIIGRFAK